VDGEVVVVELAEEKVDGEVERDLEVVEVLEVEVAVSEGKAEMRGEGVMEGGTSDEEAAGVVMVVDWVVVAEVHKVKVVEEVEKELEGD